MSEPISNYVDTSIKLVLVLISKERKNYAIRDRICLLYMLGGQRSKGSAIIPIAMHLTDELEYGLKMTNPSVVISYAFPNSWILSKLLTWHYSSASIMLLPFVSAELLRRPCCFKQNKIMGKMR